MLGKEAQPRGLSFLVLIALTALAAVRGISALTLALAVLPIAVAVLAYTDGWMAVAALCASAGVACIWRFPAPMLVGLLPWCALCGIIALVPLKNRFARPLLWAGLCVAGWAAVLGTMLSLFGAPLNEGVARAMCDLINESPQRNTILLNAYNAGLSRLDLSGPLSSLTFVLMPDATRLQLLYSLRVTLEEMLPSAMCNGIVVHTALTVLLCTVLPDWRRRRNGEKGVFPPMEEWYIPRGLGLALLVLCVGWLFATLSTGGVEVYMGLLCVAVFRAAYTLQGICLLLWMEKKMGIRSAVRNLWAVVLSMLAPIVPIIMGLIDQRRDSRHLRPDEEGTIE